MHNSYRLGLTAAGVATVLAMTACFGGDDDDPVAQGTTSSVVPDGAGASGLAFVTYLLSVMSSDETSEPSTISEGFSVPPDETADPQPLI